MGQDQTTENRFIVFTILIFCLTFLGWAEIKETFSINIFYIGYAFVIFLLSYFIYLKSKTICTFTLLSIACNNVIDEIFFNPLKFGINEPITIIIAIVVWKIYKMKLCK